MKRINGLFVFCSILVLVGSIVRPAIGAPWDKLLTFQRVEADPNKDYRLTDRNGPWMVLACSFCGENARQQAHDLVIELRRRYKLPAYMYEKKFEFGKEAPGRGVDRFGAPLRMKYRRGSEVNEIAVMVGDFETVDDPKAQQTLERIKYYRPESLEVSGTKTTARNLAAWRMLTKFVSAEKEKEGPMRKAFVTTNPLLPKDYFTNNRVDELVLQMNDGNQYSLFKCPGKYSVQVARFRGKILIDLIDKGEIQAVQEGRRPLKGTLAQAAENAEKLTEALRQKGYEAYVFHDRYASIVTVGSFDSVGTPRADGRTEINPKIHAIMKTFGVDQQSALGVGGGMKTKTLLGIPFDPQPIPVEVPKRSISGAYVREVAWR
jgi:hypothetical protein